MLWKVLGVGWVGGLQENPQDTHTHTPLMAQESLLWLAFHVLWTSCWEPVSPGFISSAVGVFQNSA